MKRFTLILLILLSTVTFGQRSPYVNSRPSILVSDTTTPPPSTNLLLDDYPGASVAFWTVKLDKDYAGACMNVRRASDNTNSDIGWLGNHLDTVTLKSFCAGTDCFVEIGYDQSGSGKNLTQTTDAAQPKIVTAGVVERNGDNLPALNFDGVNDLLTNASITWTNFGIFTKVSANFSSPTYRPIASAFTSSIGFILRQVGGTTSWWTLGSLAGNNNSAGGNLRSVVSNPGTGQHQISFMAVSGNADIYVDGVLNETHNEAATTSAITKPLSIGYYPSDYFDGTFQGFIFYASDQTSNRAGIEAIINAF